MGFCANQICGDGEIEHDLKLADGTKRGMARPKCCNLQQTKRFTAKLMALRLIN
jgi:hypothetical protein